MKLPWQGHIVDHIVSMTCLDAWAWTKESSDLPLPLCYWFSFFRHYNDVQKLLYTICVNSIDAIHNTYICADAYFRFIFSYYRRLIWCQKENLYMRKYSIVHIDPIRPNTYSYAYWRIYSMPLFWVLDWFYHRKKN